MLVAEVARGCRCKERGIKRRTRFEELEQRLALLVQRDNDGTLPDSHNLLSSAKILGCRERSAGASQSSNSHSGVSADFRRFWHEQWLAKITVGHIRDRLQALDIFFSLV